MTPTPVITALEKALEEATPGQWAWEEGSDQDDMPHLMSQGAEVCNFGDSARYYPTEGSPPNEADAAYIVACSPLAIRTLLDAHASAVRDAERYRLIRAGYCVLELLTPEARPEEGLNYRSTTLKAELNYGNPEEGAALDEFVDRALAARGYIKGEPS